MDDTAKKRPNNNTFKHCREWLETTILTQTDWRNLTAAGLLAGETILLSIMGISSAIFLMNLKGTPFQRLIALLKSIPPWLPWIILGTLLSVIAAHLAQWAEQRFRRGRAAAAVALVPVAPLVFAVFLTPSSFAMAPMLGTLSIWLLGKGWWSLFTNYLRRLANWDYGALLDGAAQVPQENDWLYEHRHYLETKRTALVERKQRWEHMANPAPDPTPAILSHDKTSTPKADSPSPWAVATLILLLVAGGLALPSIRNQTPSPAQLTAITESSPRPLTFWYQADELEASVLKDLAKVYTDSGTNVVDSNQAGDFPLQLQRAFLMGEAPDVMLLPSDLAHQLQTAWGNTQSPSGENEHTQLYFPLWPNHPWRQRLVLVISPTTQHPAAARDFVAYLSSSLSGE